MESPINLLKTAVTEQDEDIRLKKVCKSLKMISELLPFPKRNAVLLNDDDIFKFLLLVNPIVPSTVDLIIATLFEVFKTNPGLWKCILKGLESVGGMEEKNIQRHATLKLHSTNMVKSIQYLADNNIGVKPVSTTRVSMEETIRLDYPKAIMLSLVQIKLKALDCLETLLKLYPKATKKDQLDPYLEKVPAVIRRYIEVSESEKVINKASLVLQLLQKISPNPSNPDLDMQELINAKLGLPPPDKKGRSSSKKIPTEAKLRKSRSSKRSDDENESSDGSVYKANPEDFESEEEDEDDDNSNHESEELDPEAEERERLLTSFQTFLCKEETPAFSKDEFMAEAMKSSVNYEALLALMLDPQIQIIIPQWGKTFPTLLRGQGRKGTLSYNITVQPKKKAKFKDHLNLVIYQIRSYKVLQCLSDEKNYRHLISVNSKILENYYNMIYISLARDEVACNMNHLAKLTLYYLQKEEDISCNFILHLNLVFRFLYTLEFQYVQLFFFTILQFSEKQQIKAKNADNFYRYCRYSEFFVDLSKAILDGEEALDMKKADVTYKPGRIKDIIQLKADATMPEGSLDTTSRKTKIPPLPEEGSGVDVDVDNCKDLLLKNKPKYPKRLALSSLPYLPVHSLNSINKIEDASDDMALLSKYEKLKKFPSIREKWERLYQRVKSDEPSIIVSVDEEKKRKQSVTTQEPAPRKPSRILGGPGNTLGNLLGARDKRDSGISSHRTQTNNTNKTTLGASELPKLPAIRSPVLRKDSLQTSIQSTDLPSSKIPSKSTHYSMRSHPSTPFILDEALESSALNMLGNLYPLSVKAYVQSDLDKEAKKPAYQPNLVKENDEYALILAEAVHIMVRQAIENEQQAEFREKLGLKVKDYSKFWPALFEPLKSKFFDLIFKNYLFKIRVHNLKELNSGFECGEIVNLILGNCLSNQPIKNYLPNIIEISRKYFPFLVKQIIHSHAWVHKKDIKVYLQTHVVHEPIGPARIMLVKTLNLILKIDKKRDSLLHEEINDTLSHTLILWLFTYRTNNLYQNEFYSFVELSFRLLGEKHALDVLLKLELLSKMHNLLGDIYQNGVKVVSAQTESLICCFKRIIRFVSTLMEEKNYENLKNQLRASVSWSELQAQLDPKPTSSKRSTNKFDDISVIASSSLLKQEQPSSLGLTSTSAKQIRTTSPQKIKESNSAIILPKLNTPRVSHPKLDVPKNQELLPVAKNGIKSQKQGELKSLMITPGASGDLQKKMNVRSKPNLKIPADQF